MNKIKILSEEAEFKITDLLQDEYDLQNGHEDRQEEIETIIDEVKGLDAEEVTKNFLNNLREEGTYHNWFIENQNEYIVDNADACELAHRLLVVDMNKKGKETSEDEQYTKEEQEIFDFYYSIISDVIGM